MTTSVTAYAATSATEPLAQTTITRRDVGPGDVAIQIHFAGICHSDIHTVRGEWGEVSYPMVPGHEIAGIVTEVGSEVRNFTVGDRVGVGCFVDSCRECEYCLAGEEQYCNNPGMVGTYNGVGSDGQPTQGGYSGFLQAVVDLAPDLPKPAKREPRVKQEPVEPPPDVEQIDGCPDLHKPRTRVVSCAGCEEWFYAEETYRRIPRDEALAPPDAPPPHTHPGVGTTGDTPYRFEVTDEHIERLARIHGRAS